MSYVQNRTVSRRGVKETGPCSRGVSRGESELPLSYCGSSLSMDRGTLCCKYKRLAFCILCGHTFTTAGPSPGKGHLRAAGSLDDRHLGGQGAHSTPMASCDSCVLSPSGLAGSVRSNAPRHAVDASSPIHPIASLRW